MRHDGGQRPGRHHPDYVRIVSYSTGILGLLFVTVLILRAGFNNILATISVAGWRMLWLIPFHMLPLALDAAGWLILIRRPKSPQIPFPYLFWVAAVRGSINNLLPVARIGGEVVGIRLVIKRHIAAAFAVASVIVETTLTMASQYLFALVGIALLAVDIRGAALTGTLLVTLLVTVPVFVVFLLLQHSGMFQHFSRLAAKLPNGDRLLAFIGDPGLLDGEIRALYRRRTDLVRCGVWQMAGFFMGAGETWFILYLLKHEIPFGAAIMIESLSQALRSATFFVPAGIGVQEASLVLLGGVAGLSLEVATILSLAKRFRDVVFGLPVLVSWQWVEGRRLRGLFTRKLPQS